MKKFFDVLFLLSFLAVTFGATHNANARQDSISSDDLCIQVANPMNPGIAEQRNKTLCEDDGTTQYYATMNGLIAVTSCRSCYNDQPMTRITEPVTDPSGIPCSISYTICDNDLCPDCVDCESTGWTNAGVGYQTRTNAICHCGDCSKKTTYRCAVGYYGTPNSTGTSGCKKCEDDITYADWESFGAGYERRQIIYPDGCVVNVSYEYRCAANYWGTTTDGKSGCTQCPVVCSRQSSSTAGQNQNITNCCVEPNTSTPYTDVTGTFVVLNNTRTCATAAMANQTN